MNRFLSNAVNRIDAKGRVSVPAHFRSVLQQRGYAELYAIRELDVPALNVGGMDLLDRYEARIAQEDPFLQTAEDMSFFVHGDGAFLKLDQDGRITYINATLAEWLGIDLASFAPGATLLQDIVAGDGGRDALLGFPCLTVEFEDDEYFVAAVDQTCVAEQPGALPVRPGFSR